MVPSAVLEAVEEAAAVVAVAAVVEEAAEGAVAEE